MNDSTHGLPTGLEAATRRRLLRFPKPPEKRLPASEIEKKGDRVARALAAGEYLTCWTIKDSETAPQRSALLDSISALVAGGGHPVRQRLSGTVVFTANALLCGDRQWVWDSRQRHLSDIQLQANSSTLELRFSAFGPARRVWQRQDERPAILEVPVSTTAQLREAEVLCQLLRSFRARSALRQHLGRHTAPSTGDSEQN